MRVPLLARRLPFSRPVGQRDPPVNPREVDWDSPEGRALLGRQHWDERYWRPRAARSLRDALRR